MSTALTPGSKALLDGLTRARALQQAAAAKGLDVNVAADLEAVEPSTATEPPEAPEVEPGPATLEEPPPEYWETLDSQTQRGSGIVTNCRREQVVNAKTGKPKTITTPMPMADVLADLLQQTGDWPRRLDSALFVPRSGGVSWLDGPAALFGYLANTVGRVQWHGGVGYCKQAEVFAELQRTATPYLAVESLPHEPMIAEHYYACKPLGTADGSALNNLLSRFCPASDVDRELILSAFLTCLWGGPPGTRPCFVITSDHGRGAGKSTVAEMAGELFGGVLTFSHNEDFGRIKSRLLSADAATKRVCLLDNVKSHKFSWADLEGLVTASTVNGHRWYVGDGARPNILVWFVTLNGAALSTDMAQRSVIIKLDRPTRSASWLDDTRQFIRDHRNEILADLAAVLRAAPTMLSSFSRWATWEREILQRLPVPADAQLVILERQAVVDVEAEDATLVEDFIAEELSSRGYDTESERVHIPSKLAAEWYGLATNERHGTGTVSRILRQLIDEGRLRRLKVNHCKSWGRGYVWTGQHCTPATAVQTDIHNRQRFASQWGA